MGAEFVPRGLRASDWLDTKEPMHRIEVYLAENPDKKVPGIPGLLQITDQLARRADVDGRNAWPSIALMCARTGMSARAITAHLKTGVRVGLFAVDKNPTNPQWKQLPANHRPTAYRLLYGEDFGREVREFLAAKRARRHEG